jgi:hypothetical protein
VSDEQFGFDLGEAPQAGQVAFDPDEIREDLATMLADARAVSEAEPWDAKTLRYNKILFPLVASWLPEDEARQYCFEFTREVERITLLLAA